MLFLSDIILVESSWSLISSTSPPVGSSHCACYVQSLARIQVYYERDQTLDVDFVVCPNHAVVYLAEEELVEGDEDFIGAFQ